LQVGDENHLTNALAATNYRLVMETHHYADITASSEDR